jgi:hypothetical protein
MNIVVEMNVKGHRHADFGRARRENNFGRAPIDDSRRQLTMKVKEGMVSTTISYRKPCWRRCNERANSCKEDRLSRQPHQKSRT